ncbi:MAG: porin [Pseudomonadota bacterium]
MKKVLFATTALVASAGMAAAEVSFGGFGRFGLFYQENATGTNETRIEQRFRLTITGSTTSDNGLEFEGRIRFQSDYQSTGASNTAQSSAAGFAVTSGGFRLDVGHVSNVIDSGDVVDYYGYGIGLTSFIEQSSKFSNTAVGFGSSQNFSTIAPTIKLRYTAGDFTVSASVTDDAVTQSASLTTGVFTPGGGNSSYQIGASYSFGDYTIGAAFGSSETAGGTGPDNDEWIINFAGEVGALGFSVIIGDSDAQTDTSYGFSVKYDIGAATEIRFAFSDSGAPGNSDAYGIGFRHSLGGGVSLRGGIGDNSGITTADLGVIFDF